MQKILVVDDDPGMIQLVGRMVGHLGEVRFALGGKAALTSAREHPPDLVLLDSEMPSMSGWDVCAALKAAPETAAIPVIFVTANSGEEQELRGLAMGGADFITKPISEPLLLARVGIQLQMKQLTDELRRLATLDALTGIANRRTLDHQVALEWKRSRRSRSAMSLLMVDVDHFKLFNDRYGHPVGDSCLRIVAQALSEACLRPADLVARYGGEEFAILLPDTNAAGAANVAQRVSDAVSARAIPHLASTNATHVTVSVGVSTCTWQPGQVDGLDEGTLVKCADAALYAAKRAGRAQAWSLDVGTDAAEPAFVQRRDPTCRLRVVA